MKIAVTGASGFVGSHVLRALVQTGECDIVVATRSGNSIEPQTPAIRTVVFDLTEANENVFDQLGRPDVLVHLAWGGLPNYLSRHHFEVELPAQYRFLKAMVEGGLGAMLVTGTCAEYGMMSGALSEEMTAAPANPYAYAKAALHKQLEFLQEDDLFVLTWARLFYMFGAGQSPSSIYSLLTAAAERGDTAFPMSKGEQLRDFLPVEEVARLLVELALRRSDFGTVNVCSGEPTSIRSLVEGWIADRGWQIGLDLGKYPYPRYEPLAFWGTRSRLNMVLGK